MPASAGRVRMPHNNRMSTSGALQTSAIWQKTIGHDPHNEGGTTILSSEQHQERVDATELVLAAAREQNATGQTQGRDNFALKLYQGLKQKKKQRVTDADEADAAKRYPSREEILLQEQDSTSEEEYVVAAKKEPTDKMKKNKRRHRHDDTGSSSDSSSLECRRRKRKKHKRKRKHTNNNDADNDDSSSSHSRKKKKKDKTSRHQKPSQTQTR